MTREYLNIEDLLPQRPPFILVDELIFCDDEATETRLFIRPDNLFVEAGVLTAEGVAENVAQTCAARMGYMTRQQGGAVRIGVIGAIRSFALHRNPCEGEEISTRIRVEEELMDITLVSAMVYKNDELLAEAKMTIALTNQTV